jgi:DNA-binding MarR family transcriptional regulator
MATDPPRVPSKADYMVLAQFRTGLRRFLAFSAAAAEAAGLTPRQHQALLAIKGAEAEAVTVGELAEQLQIRHHSATELADRLVQAGLVDRAADPLDRRRVLLRLTAAAEAVLGDLSEAHLGELAALRPVLRLLLEALERSDPGGGGRS